MQDKDAANATPGGGRMKVVNELSSAHAHNVVNSAQRDKSKKRPRILVVEDDLSLAQLVASYLTAHEFTVVITSTGELAVTTLETFIPDLVVLDLELSGCLSGWDVLQDLRRHVTIPVILTTSMTLSMRKYFRSCGETRLTLDHLPKPYTVQTLLRRIKRMLLISPT